MKKSILFLGTLIFSFNVYAKPDKDIEKYQGTQQVCEEKNVNKLGNEIDECRDKFLASESSCQIKDILKCYTFDIQRNRDIQKCYKNVYEKILIQYYPQYKKELINSFNKYVSSIYETNLTIYSKSKFCQEGCGLLPSLLANQTTTYDIQNHIIRMLEYLEKEHCSKVGHSSVRTH